MRLVGAVGRIPGMEQRSSFSKIPDLSKEVLVDFIAILGWHEAYHSTKVPYVRAERSSRP